MLKIERLTVSTGSRKVAGPVDLTVNDGEIHVLMGPNGAGKSSLANAIMGHPEFKVEGKLVYNGEDLVPLSADRRAAMGVFLAFQHPYEIEGVNVAKFMDKAKGARGERQDIGSILSNRRRLEKGLKQLGLSGEFMQRELNVGFSGGEKKRMEIVQMTELQPRLAVLDEIDSGLDIDGIKLVAKTIKKMNDGKRCFIIITHYPRILKYLKPDYVHVMVTGKIVETGMQELMEKLERKGYDEYTKKEGA